MPATNRPQRGGGAFQVRVVVNADRASDEMKQARRDINQRMKEALIAAGKQVALPAARAVAWRFAKPMLTVKATRSSAYVTTQGNRKLGRAVGLLEFGGTVRTVIRPKNAQALLVGPDVIRSEVTTPRRYMPSLRMTAAVHARKSQIEDAMLGHVMHAFDGFPHNP